MIVYRGRTFHVDAQKSMGILYKPALDSARSMGKREKSAVNLAKRGLRRYTGIAN